MTLHLTIPEEIVASIKLPREQVEKQLQIELSFLLYAKGMASMGAARRLAGLSKWEFLEGLRQRDILRHYDETSCEEDITYAKSCQ